MKALITAASRHRSTAEIAARIGAVLSRTVDVTSDIADSRALDQRVFAGALLRDRLSFGERAIIAALRAPYGDFRDWAAIEA